MSLCINYGTEKVAKAQQSAVDPNKERKKERGIHCATIRHDIMIST
jgi:hypothetical protein